MDWSRLLNQHLSGSSLVRSNRLTGGVSADVYGLTLQDGRQIVARIEGATYSGLGVEKEFELLNALHKAGVIVPRPLAVDLNGANPCLLMAFCDGEKRFDDLDLGQRLSVMAKALLGLHQLALDIELPSRTDPLPECLDYLPEGEEWTRFRTGLAGLNPPPFEGREAVLHGDFWPGNLLWQGNELTAILDWEDAAIGDPLSDIACACLELEYVYGKAGAEAFLAAYQALWPVDPERFALWQIYVSAAAQRFMGGWGMAPEKEAHMRSVAMASVRRAGEKLGLI
ncbi:MAG: phosphotransferase [Pseudomonadota bacterium]